MTKFKIVTKSITIDINDPENAVILKAKNRADAIMEWAKMFHQAHWVFLIGSFVLVFTPFDRIYWVAFGMFIFCFLMSYLLSNVARNHLRNTIIRNMPNE